MGQPSGALLGRERVWKDDGEGEAPAVLLVPLLPSPPCQLMKTKASLTLPAVQSWVHSSQALIGYLLCAKFCARHWGLSIEQKRRKHLVEKT